MRLVSPANHPSSFPELLTPLDFILFADGGVPAIVKSEPVSAKKAFREK